MRITRTLAAALAIAALGASTAQAQPLDMHASTAIAAAKAQHKQDLRSADARDAIRNPRNFDVPSRHAPTVKVAAVDASSGTDWTAIAIGSGLGLLAIGGLFALNSLRVRRLHGPRTVA
jgi:hypothetical protein